MPSSPSPATILCPSNCQRPTPPSISSTLSYSSPDRSRARFSPPSIAPGAGPAPRRPRSLGSPATLTRKASICLGFRSVSCTLLHISSTLSAILLCSCFSLTTSAATLSSIPSSSSPSSSPLSFFFPQPLFLRTISLNRFVCPLRNDACANSHRSGSTFRNPYIQQHAGQNEFIRLNCYLSVELADEAGEVAVLEVGGEEELREGKGVDDDEAVVVAAPGNDGVSGGVVHHAVGLQHEGSSHRTAATPSCSSTVAVLVVAAAETGAAIFHANAGRVKTKVAVTAAADRRGGVAEDG
ncbi:hypothetical protein C4D60_Mb10t03600 [Musa balbisiana]|uniref:Uncharacterized protein n=1 Tax=Musa balbisiana TaxID=52838 RepID=A0A4S8IUE2_MUSBA|nr:hypothetical protein C4D60_Mb10t03600 [Musa balbisiana]